jgi:hypothetical protein
LGKRNILSIILKKQFVCNLLTMVVVFCFVLLKNYIGYLFCITNDPKPRLKVNQNLVWVGQEFENTTVRWFWLKVSYEVAVSVSTQIGRAYFQGSPFMYLLVEDLSLSISCWNVHMTWQLTTSKIRNPGRELRERMRERERSQCLWASLRSNISKLLPYSINHPVQHWYPMGGDVMKMWIEGDGIFKDHLRGWLPQILIRNAMLRNEGWWDSDSKYIHMNKGGKICRERGDL